MPPFIQRPSANFDGRDGAAVDMLVLHYTGMRTGAEALERLCDPAAKVSAHYVVEEDGRVFTLVEESMRAWHAGVSEWRGRSGVNAYSIGVEIVNPGHEFGYRQFPDAQMQSVIALCQGILSRHPIPPRNVVGHSDIAPSRKEDPGELFDWPWLAREGIGLWPSMQESDRIADVQELAEYGYCLGEGAQGVREAVVAFQRHFHPTLLDGVWTEACGRMLAGLLASAR